MGSAERRWLAGGALGVVVLFALGWFFLISPQRDQAEALDTQTATAQQQVATLQRRLVELREQSANLPKYREQLARDRAALPTEAGLSDFLRELHVAGGATGVSVKSVVVGGPTEVNVEKSQVFALPIAVTAVGNGTRMRQFLDQLQRVRPRAVLIDTVDAAPVETGGSLNDEITLTFNLKAYVAEAPAGARSASAA
jgi:Tfp pilus assembly protein PilO